MTQVLLAAEGAPAVSSTHEPATRQRQTAAGLASWACLRGGQHPLQRSCDLLCGEDALHEKRQRHREGSARPTGIGQLVAAAGEGRAVGPLAAPLPASGGPSWACLEGSVAFHQAGGLCRLAPVACTGHAWQELTGAEPLGMVLVCQCQDCCRQQVQARCSAQQGAGRRDVADPPCSTPPAGWEGMPPETARASLERSSGSCSSSSKSASPGSYLSATAVCSGRDGGGGKVDRRPTSPAARRPEGAPGRPCAATRRPCLPQ